jgi:hypothetical protein
MAQLTLTPLTPIFRHDKYRSNKLIINENDKKSARSFFCLSCVDCLNYIRKKGVKNKATQGQKTLVARYIVTLYQGDTILFIHSSLIQLFMYNYEYSNKKDIIKANNKKGQSNRNQF